MSQMSFSKLLCTFLEVLEVLKTWLPVQMGSLQRSTDLSKTSGMLKDYFSREHMEKSKNFQLLKLISTILLPNLTTSILVQYVGNTG